MNLITKLVSKREKIEFGDDKCCNKILCNNLLSIKVLNKKNFSFELRFEEERLVFSFSDEELGRKNYEFLFEHFRDEVLDLSECSAAMLFSEFDSMTAKIRENQDRYAQMDYDSYLERNSKEFRVAEKIDS